MGIKWTTDPPVLVDRIEWWRVRSNETTRPQVIEIEMLSGGMYAVCVAGISGATPLSDLDGALWGGRVDMGEGT